MHFIKTILTALCIMPITISHAYAKDYNIRSYTERGVKYYPKYVKEGTIKYAKASWYGKPFHGRLTANGERYNMYKLSAAHRTYAMGTIVRVTNQKNKRSVVVRINDRGPFYTSRAIDLSYAAAKRLGFVKKGVENVKIEVLSSKKEASRKTYSIQKKYKYKRKARQVTKYVRDKKVQLAAFFSKKNADLFKKRHNLKHVSIVKKYIRSRKKTAYKIVVSCTTWEANNFLTSKKFRGAYKV